MDINHLDYISEFQVSLLHRFRIKSAESAARAVAPVFVFDELSVAIIEKLNEPFLSFLIFLVVVLYPSMFCLLSWFPYPVVIFIWHLV